VTTGPLEYVVEGSVASGVASEADGDGFAAIMLGGRGAPLIDVEIACASWTWRRSRPRSDVLTADRTRRRRGPQEMRETKSLPPPESWGLVLP
jgi:hypothetical protein